MSEKNFNEDYFTSYLQDSGCLSEGSDGKHTLTKVSNITIGHVLAAHSFGTFSDQDILRWVHKGRKLTPLIEEQFLLYKQLSKFLINFVKPEDVDAFKEILIDRKFVWPIEGKEGWASVFGEVPELCHKISLEQTERKTSCDEEIKGDDEMEDIIELDYDEDFESEDEEVKDSDMLDLCKNINVKQVEQENSRYDLSNIETLNTSDQRKTKTLEKNCLPDEVTKEMKDFNSRVSKKEESLAKKENGEGIKDIEKDEKDKSEIEGFEEDFFTNDFFSDDDDEEDGENNSKNDKVNKEVFFQKSKLDNEEDFESGNKGKLSKDKNVESEEEEDKGSDILHLHAEDDFSEEIKDNEERSIHKPLKERLSFETKGFKESRWGIPLKTVFDPKGEQEKNIILEKKAVKNIHAQQSEAKYSKTEICKKEKQYKKVYLVGNFASRVAQRLLLRNTNVIPLENNNNFKKSSGMSKIDDKLMKILKLKPKDTLFILLINYEFFTDELYSTFENKSSNTKYPVSNIRMGDNMNMKSKWKLNTNLNVAEKYLQNIQNHLLPELCSTVVFAPLYPQVYFMYPNENDQKDMDAFHQTFLELQVDRQIPLLIPSVTTVQKAELFSFMGGFPKDWMNYTKGILNKNNISTSLFDKYPNCSQYQFASFESRADTMRTDKKLRNMWEVLLKLFIQQILPSEKELKGVSTSEVPCSGIARLQAPGLPPASVPPTRAPMPRFQPPLVPHKSHVPTRAPIPNVPVHGMPPKSLVPTGGPMPLKNLTAPVVQPQFIKTGTNQPSSHMKGFYNVLPTSVQSSVILPPGFPAQTVEISQSQFKNSLKPGVSNLSHQPPNFPNSAIPPAASSQYGPNFYQPPSSLPNIMVQPSASSQPFVHAPPINFQPSPSSSNIVNSQYSHPPPNLPNAVAIPLNCSQFSQYPSSHPNTATVPPTFSQFSQYPQSHPKTVSVIPTGSQFSQYPPSHPNTVSVPPTGSQFSQYPPSHPNTVAVPPTRSKFSQYPPSHPNTVAVPPSGLQFSQPLPSHPNALAIPSQNKNTSSSTSSASSITTVHSVPQVPRGINIALLKNIPKVLKNDVVEKLLSGCGKIYKYERRALSSDVCSVHYHDGESSLRCKRLLNCRTIMDTKLKVELPYENSFTHQERAYINQGMENVATFAVNQNIKKIEEEYMQISDDIKQFRDSVAKSEQEIFKRVEGGFEWNQNNRGGIKATQKSKSKSPDIKVIKMGSLTPERKERHSGCRKTDGSDSSGSRSPKINSRMSRNRSPSNRKRRSKSRSSKTRHKKSRSRSSEGRHGKTEKSSHDKRYRRSRSKHSDKTHRKMGNRSPDRRHNRSEIKGSDRRSRSKNSNRMLTISSSSSSDSRSSDRSNTKSRSTSPDIKYKRSRGRSTEMDYKESRSRKLETLEKHKSKQNIELNDLYMTPVTQNNSFNLQRETNQFSVIGACQLLMGFCDKIGYLGHSLRAALVNVQNCGNNSSKIIKSLIDSEGQELLGLIAGKFKNLSGGTQDSMLLSKYNQALIATNFLLKHIEFYLDISKLDQDSSENTINKVTERNIKSSGSSNNGSSSYSYMNDLNRSHKNVSSIDNESNASGSSKNTGSEQLSSEEILLLQKLLGKKKEHVLSSSLYTGLQKSFTTQDSHMSTQDSHMRAHNQRGLPMEHSSQSTFITPPAISNMLEEVGEDMGLNTDLNYNQHYRNQMF